MQLLNEATWSLDLPSAATLIFNKQGERVFSFEDLVTRCRELSQGDEELLATQERTASALTFIIKETKEELGKQSLQGGSSGHVQFGTSSMIATEEKERGVEEEASVGYLEEEAKMVKETSSSDSEDAALKDEKEKAVGTEDVLGEPADMGEENKTEQSTAQQVKEVGTQRVESESERQETGSIANADLKYKSDEGEEREVMAEKVNSQIMQSAVEDAYGDSDHHDNLLAAQTCSDDQVVIASDQDNSFKESGSVKAVFVGEASASCGSGKMKYLKGTSEGPDDCSHDNGDPSLKPKHTQDEQSATGTMTTSAESTAAATMATCDYTAKATMVMCTPDSNQTTWPNTTLNQEYTAWVSCGQPFQQIPPQGFPGECVGWWQVVLVLV